MTNMTEAFVKDFPEAQVGLWSGWVCVCGGAERLLLARAAAWVLVSVHSRGRLWA